MPSRFPLGLSEEDNATAPAPQSRRHHRHGVARRLVPVISAGTAAGVLALLAFIGLFFVVRRLRRRQLAAESGIGTVPPHLLRISYSELRRATGNFSPEHKLGQGGFGPVFRGVLPSTGEAVAVKVMHSTGSLQGAREFHNELALASHLLPHRCPHLLLPFGFCLSSPSPTLFSRFRRRRSQGLDLVGIEDETAEIPNPRMILVYKLMPFGSLQDALLGSNPQRRCSVLAAQWRRRHAVAVDVARALQFLHSISDPPVIHGDVKPSNVLLDADFTARLADFGLARVLEKDEQQRLVGMGDGDEEREDEINSMAADDVSVVESTTSISMTAPVPNLDGGKSPEEEVDGCADASPTEAASLPGIDRSSIDSGRDGRKNWWWRQDTASEPGAYGGASGTTPSSGSGVKDYVMEWIQSEIKRERPKGDWMAGTVSSESREKGKKSKPRQAREWWREEFADELMDKQRRRRAFAKSRSTVDSPSSWNRRWWVKDDEAEKSATGWRKKSWSHRASSASVSWWIEGTTSGEIKRTSSRDWGGREMPKSSGAVSSTPSMRGTVCYVAPEYGGGGPVSEKCDIYSFGVLLLVLISGRRPLQVSISPMSEFERASLVSWARHLALVNRLLDLVDSAIEDVDREQALLCINIALLCIQRTPAHRPTSREVLSMLTGEAKLPDLPVEFSPSPPGRFKLKSHKKS